MKKWMILAAAILVVLGIGFAVKGASDKKQGATPEGTAVPETTTSAPNEETETANALREETETEDGAEEIDTLCGQITEINDEAGHGAGQHLRRHALQRFAPAG